MKNQVTWTTKDGRTAVVEASETEVVSADGVPVTVERFSLRATVDGKLVGTGMPRKVEHPVAVAAIGKLGFVQERYDEIMALPAVRRHLDKVEANRFAIAELNATRRRNGYCEKCGTYCNGDCDA